MIPKSAKTFFAILFVCISAAAIFAQKSELKVVTETKKITAEEIKAFVKPSANKRPVLINFWATWCGPCRTEFPDLVKIDADYRAKGLNFIVVSVDDFAVIETRVPEFLKSYESTMPSYLINLPSRREIASAVRQIAPTFRDVYPTTLLFDAGGRLVFQKAGKVDAKILRTEIDKVLSKSRK